ncbi:hypothetical protein B0T14DRAFT_501045 [Immersiella caudata]|uniref:Uncharacterized protein n=1 Tax=Immersiella caudata TaxID=314043 RepID=A0AA39WC90_9PEZI|nr:hypothetical protein B0T14DRAFT_501045 [Immersiella caudata]
MATQTLYEHIHSYVARKYISPSDETTEVTITNFINDLLVIANTGVSPSDFNSAMKLGHAKKVRFSDSPSDEMQVRVVDQSNLHNNNDALAKPNRIHPIGEKRHTPLPKEIEREAQPSCTDGFCRHCPLELFTLPGSIVSWTGVVTTLYDAAKQWVQLIIDDGSIWFTPLAGLPSSLKELLGGPDTLLEVFFFFQLDRITLNTRVVIGGVSKVLRAMANFCRPLREIEVAIAGVQKIEKTLPLRSAPLNEWSGYTKEMERLKKMSDNLHPLVKIATDEMLSLVGKFINMRDTIRGELRPAAQKLLKQSIVCPVMLRHVADALLDELAKEILEQLRFVDADIPEISKGIEEGWFDVQLLRGCEDMEEMQLRAFRLKIRSSIVADRYRSWWSDARKLRLARQIRFAERFYDSASTDVEQDTDTDTVMTGVKDLGDTEE